MNENIYYHVLIELDEKKLSKANKYLQICDCDIEDIEEINKDILVPYYSRNEIYADGRNIPFANIRSLKIKSSDKKIDHYVNIAQQKLYELSVYTYTRLDILNSTEYLNDVTKQLRKGLDFIDKKIEKIEEDGNLSKIFISHATKDKVIIEEIIELLEAIGVDSEQIFCSSFEGYGIPLGENFLDQIKKELSSEVLVLFVLTENFYESKICLCEMGAAWALSKQHIPIVVPPLNYSDIQCVIPLTQGLLINDISKLNSFKERIEQLFNLNNKLSFSTWERKRERFIRDVETNLSVS